MKNKIILVGGDPNSINSEIIAKSWKKFNNYQKKRIFLITNYELINAQIKYLKLPLKVKKVINLDHEIKGKYLKVIDLNLNFKKPFKVSRKSSSKFVLDSLDLAHKLAQRKDVSGVINCAINKNLLNRNKIGVTEYLASKCGVKNNSEVMLIHNKKLSVCPVTTHVDIKQVSKKLNSNVIIKKINTINSWFNQKFNRKPKIGVLGLNPHNAENRKNTEEKKVIRPAIQKLKKANVNISGPLVADTIFIKDYKKFDVIIGMYHDQVLGPFKTLFKYDAINITLGLKYLRLSPDHGTAVSLIKKNKADPLSLIRCFNFINKFSK
mgnify:CR=1 FL=1|tara:strand:+ start:503 stop:1468 length:966 start_codon:yes stop_codon:yes gene_type:complete